MVGFVMRTVLGAWVLMVLLGNWHAHGGPLPAISYLVALIVVFVLGLAVAWLRSGRGTYRPPTFYGTPNGYRRTR